MKLFLDPKDISYEVILDEYSPTAEGAVPVINFANEALTTHEVMGGVYWLDNSNQQHYVELTNQKLYAIMYLLKAMALRQPLSVVYMKDPASSRLLKSVFGYFSLIIRFLQTIKLIKKVTYDEAFDYLDKYPSKKVLRAVCKQQ